MISLPVDLSRLPQGSSAKRMDGDFTRALAMAPAVVPHLTAVREGDLPCPQVPRVQGTPARVPIVLCWPVPACLERAGVHSHAP